MKIIIDSMITITGASSSELQKIIEDNRYPNPAIASAKKMKRKYHFLPEYVYTYEQNESGIVVPVGYLDELLKLFPNCTIEDKRTICPASIPSMNITLRDYQERIFGKAIQCDQGIMQADTGAGKTILGLSVIQHRQQRTLILTHSKNLQQQWFDEIKNLMGIDAGIIGGGKWEEKDITIGMLQTLAKNPDKLLDYGLVLGDEIHHIAAQSFYKVINKLSCKYRYGLTATPHRNDGLHVLINRCIGPIIDKTTLEEVQAAGGVLPVTIANVRTGFSYHPDSWNDFLKLITNDNARNELIISLARKASYSMPTLIMVDRIEHAEKLSEMAGIEHTLIHGKLKNRTELMDSITDNNLTIGTTGLLGEGLNITAWTTLILANPISSRVKLLQAIGRVMRTGNNKTNCYVVDLIDHCGFGIASYKKRLKIYQEKQYTLIERDYSKKLKGAA
ncbi:MAG: DEAD/DEAH box helicase family protein [gamma proteobacterium symbiont of Taylorina sp.]|nr:DEAD/DEAH box helicase family protein [gamma proteobacterium symbiont of Taylorina sp.]